MKSSGTIRHLKTFAVLALGLLLAGAASFPAFAYSTTTRSADRAVEIAKRSRDRVEQRGKGLKASSQALFREFAERTAELQRLLDTRERLEEAGFLAKGDPEGDARRAHINGKILMEVGALKTACDEHLASLLYALDSFDEAVAASLADTQATRSINTNYELVLEQYLKREKERFDHASGDARDALEAYRAASEDPAEKRRLLKRYNRAKRRVLQISQRRSLYEARVKVAAMNQKITGLIREKIRLEGHDVSARYRDVLASLYNTFAKIIPVAEIGGTGSQEILANLGFPHISEMRKTLEIVDDSVGKLGGVLDDMVDEVLAGLDEVKVVNDEGLSTESLSIEEELEFLRKERQAWNG